MKNILVVASLHPVGVYQKSSLSNCLILVRAPTAKAVGSIDVTKLEPTASVVGLWTSDRTDGFTRQSNRKKRLSQLLRQPLSAALNIAQVDFYKAIARRSACHPLLTCDN